jgi:hypothetical protein
VGAVAGSGQTSGRGDPGKTTAAGQLVSAMVFGLAFGFLLQKGGVAKYHVLMGMMLLEDFTVAKVMLTAITVAAGGLFVLNNLGLVKLQVPPTRYGANILGGIIFGIGFGLLAYCPGTDAAAAGQGNLDSLVGIVGLLAGSYLFAMASGFLDRTVNQWGDRGKLTLPHLLRISPGLFIAVLTPVLVGALILMELTTRR